MELSIDFWGISRLLCDITRFAHKYKTMNMTMAMTMTAKAMCLKNVFTELNFENFVIKKPLMEGAYGEGGEGG